MTWFLSIPKLLFVIAQKLFFYESKHQEAPPDTARHKVPLFLFKLLKEPKPVFKTLKPVFLAIPKPAFKNSKLILFYPKTGF